MITVKVAKAPGAVVEVVLDSGATVSDAIEAAGKTVDDGQGVSLNGSSTQLSASVSDGDRVVIAKGAKGNA